MKFLLDVNVLVAWGWADHLDHNRTANWIASVRKIEGIALRTSTIPQLGFVRVSVQRAVGRVRVKEAVDVLAGLINALGEMHAFIEDDHRLSKRFRTGANQPPGPLTPTLCSSRKSMG